MSDTLNNLHRRFDHAALKSDVTEKDIIQLCAEATEYNFFSVAVNPCWVNLAHSELIGSRVKVLGVSGFPLGAHRTDIKVAEAVKGVSDGAAEIDMVANIGWLVAGEFERAEKEVAEIRAAIPYNVTLKVIIEAGMLTIDQQHDATRMVVHGNGQFVKTCTGFFGGTTVEQVKNLYTASREEIGVKASGGIRTLAQCLEYLNTGATRLGSSSSVAIMAELKALNS